MDRQICLGCAATFIIFLGGCASPDLRTAAYQNIGSEAILIQPQHSVPLKRSVEYKLNDIRFIPGSLVLPSRVIPRDDLSMKSQQWFSNSADFCPPPPRLYHLHDLATAEALPDISIDYSINLTPEHVFAKFASFQWLAAATYDEANSRNRAARDLGLSNFELRYIREIHIQITNIRKFSADTAQLESARASIERECPRLARKASQVSSAYVGDLRVSVLKEETAQIDVGLVAAHVLRKLSYQQSGKSQILFIKASEPAGF